MGPVVTEHRHLRANGQTPARPIGFDSHRISAFRFNHILGFGRTLVVLEFEMPIPKLAAHGPVLKYMH